MTPKRFVRRAVQAGLLSQEQANALIERFGLDVDDGARHFADWATRRPQPADEESSSSSLFLNGPCPEETELLAEQLIIEGLLTAWQVEWLLESTSAQSNLPPILIQKRFVLLECLAGSNMSQVYIARDRDTNATVVVKFPPREMLKNPLRRARFEREGLAASQLGEHPFIVKCLTVGCQDDFPYLVLEYVHGPSLARKLRQRGRFHPSRAVKYALQIALALQFAHKRRFIHRDIKPSNLVVGKDDTLRLLDFGIVRQMLPSDDDDVNSSMDMLTRTGACIGSIDYMAPEQARHPGSADARCDLYSLGCTLFEMLSGRLPYKGASPLDVMLNHAHQPIPPLRHINEKLQQILSKLMAKDPQDRFDSADDLVVELEKYLVQHPEPCPIDPKLGANRSKGSGAYHPKAVSPGSLIDETTTSDGSDGSNSLATWSGQSLSDTSSSTPWPDDVSGIHRVDPPVPGLADRVAASDSPESDATWALEGPTHAGSSMLLIPLPPEVSGQTGSTDRLVPAKVVETQPMEGQEGSSNELASSTAGQKSLRSARRPQVVWTTFLSACVLVAASPSLYRAIADHWVQSNPHKQIKPVHVDKKPIDDVPPVLQARNLLWKMSQISSSDPSIWQPFWQLDSHAVQEGARAVFEPMSSEERAQAFRKILLSWSESDANVSQRHCQAMTDFWIGIGQTSDQPGPPPLHRLTHVERRKVLPLFVFMLQWWNDSHHHTEVRSAFEAVQSHGDPHLLGEAFEIALDELPPGKQRELLSGLIRSVLWTDRPEVPQSALSALAHAGSSPWLSYWQALDQPTRLAVHRSFTKEALKAPPAMTFTPVVDRWMMHSLRINEIDRLIADCPDGKGQQSLKKWLLVCFLSQPRTDEPLKPVCKLAEKLADDDLRQVVDYMVDRQPTPPWWVQRIHDPKGTGNRRPDIQTRLLGMYQQHQDPMADTSPMPSAVLANQP